MSQNTFLRFSAKLLDSIEGWALCIALVTGVFAVQVAGGLHGWINPETWSSAFFALAAAGMLHWAVVPLALISGTSLLIVIVSLIANFLVQR